MVYQTKLDQNNGALTLSHSRSDSKDADLAGGCLSDKMVSYRFKIALPLLSTPHGICEQASPFADCERSLTAADILPIDMKCRAVLCGVEP